MKWFLSSLGGDSNLQFLLHFLVVLSRLKKYSRGGLQLIWLDETELLNLGSEYLMGQILVMDLTHHLLLLLHLSKGFFPCGLKELVEHEGEVERTRSGGA